MIHVLLVEDSAVFVMGHTHIRQIADALNRMGDRVECEKIILAHFSMKYSEKYIREMIAKEIPERFIDRIVAFI